MINPDLVGVGDFVEVTEVFKDYAKVGDIYRLLDSRVPKEPTTAVGWKVSLSDGQVDTTQAFKLPHDKVSLITRSKIATLFSDALAKAKSKISAAEREYSLIKNRVDGLLNHQSKEEERRRLMDKVFYWM